jgi:hypothetical protein
LRHLLDAFPNGAYAGAARRSLADLQEEAPVTPPRQRELDYRAPPAPTLRHHFVQTPGPDYWLALRTRPSVSEGDRIRKMPNGTLVEVLSQRPDGWWRVRAVDTNETGWALSGGGGKRWLHCCKSP